jgi:hypothetical protein
VTINDDGSYGYKPSPRFVGSDSFSYAVTDNHGQTATATMNLTINPAG